MRQTPQSPRYHGEGDVFTHTMMVCEALKSLPEYQELDDTRQHLLYVAALIHDVGKIRTTVTDDSDYSAPHHAPQGSRMARELLWKDYGMSGTKELVELREAICFLVRYHSLPPVVINNDDARLRLHRLAANGLLSPWFSIRHLCTLGKADTLGRIAPDQQESLDNIALCEELAQEEECYDSCYTFPSEHTRRAFLARRDVWKNQPLHDDSRCEVTLLCGLPGTGKDYWIHHNMEGMPVISLDEIRRANKISPTDKQGSVAQMAREQAKVYLRKRQPFVWNATNIMPQMRQSLINLFESYHARVRIVYLETDWRTLLTRNSGRENVVPQSVIEKMLRNLVLPEAHEARTVEWRGV